MHASIRADARDSKRSRRGLHDPDRPARGRRHHRLGQHHPGARPSRGRRHRSAWATPTPTTATAQLIHDKLADKVRGPRRHGHPRRLGRDGPGDPQPRPARRRLDGDLRRRCGLWDLKADLLDLPLVTLLGGRDRRAGLRQRRLHVLLRTSKLQEQLGGWAEEGIPRVKMKIGTPSRRTTASACRAARKAIGDDVELFVDANGASTASRRIGVRRSRAVRRVGRRLVRGTGFRRRPGRVAPAARPGPGAAWTSRPASTATTCRYFRRMLEAGAVDVLQADATPLRRDHRLSAGRRAVRPSCLALSAHCARRCTCTPAAPSCRCGTWSISTTTPASSRCCSTALSTRRRASASRPVAAGHGAGVQARRRRALSRLEKLDAAPREESHD